MIVQVLLFLASLMGVLAALYVPGQTDFLLVAAPSALASLYLVLATLRKAKAARRRNWIVVDGSNVMHWKDNRPSLETLREVLAELRRNGFAPGIVFDANAGYKLADAYKHEYAMGKMLGLAREDVMVVSKGQSADPIILAAARDAGARIVTNDRYRDWSETFPEVTAPGHLVRGGYRDGKLWLELDEATQERDLRRA
jgi:Zc3h12a-like Ribonuclease NYN domain